MKNKNFKPHKIKKPKTACSCCKLKYYTGSIIDGIDIIQEKIDYPDNYQSVTIPRKEYKNLRNLLDNLINKE